MLAFARYRNQLKGLYHKGVYRDSCQVRKIKIYEKIIHSETGVINSRWDDEKCKNLGLNSESSFEHIFMKLKLLSPLDKEVKNISSLKDPFNFWQVSEA